MKHVNSMASCPACEIKLKDAHPDLADWFRDYVKPKHNDCHISCSYRGKADQEKAFNDGASRLHFPMSYHNKNDDQGNPCSLALDLFELDYHGQACWSWGYFRTIAEETEKAAYPITWGGTFAKIADGPHFQLEVKKT